MFKRIKVAIAKYYINKSIKVLNDESKSDQYRVNEAFHLFLKSVSWLPADVRETVMEFLSNEANQMCKNNEEEEK